ncbi:MAG TPA: hypothetical protein VFO48_10110 [Vicinamibacterales bacterium]|nr:hypothetical protein [Vicinamibacterales bacterium]
MIIKRVGPLSFARLTGLLYAVIGLLIGGIFSLAAMAGVSDSHELAGFGVVIGVAAVIVFPILYGGLGFLTSLVAAWLYNLAAGMVGGVELDIQ